MSDINIVMGFCVLSGIKFDTMEKREIRGKERHRKLVI